MPLEDYCIVPHSQITAVLLLEDSRNSLLCLAFMLGPTEQLRKLHPASNFLSARMAPGSQYPQIKARMEEGGVFGSCDIQEEISGHSMLHCMCQPEERVALPVNVHKIRVATASKYSLNLCCQGRSFKPQ